MTRRLIMTGLMIACLSAATHVFAEDVFVTPKGKKYHKEICRLIQKRSVTSLEKDAAVGEGYVPCGKCFKEDLAAEETPSKIESKGQKKG